MPGVRRQLLSFLKISLGAVLAITFAGAGYLAVFVLFAPELPDTPVTAPDSRTISELQKQPQVVQLFSASQNSTGDTENTRRRDLLGAPRVLRSTSFAIDSRSPDATADGFLHLYLVGPVGAANGWQIDGFLLLESFTSSGLYSRTLVGDTDEIVDGKGRLITRTGRKSQRFADNELNIAELIAADDVAHLRVQLLTYDDSGSVSELNLLSARR